MSKVFQNRRISKYRRHIFPFEVISPESNILSQPFLLHFHALLHSGAATILSSHPAWRHPHLQNRSPWWLFWSWEGKKNMHSHLGWAGKLLQHSDVLLSQEMLDAQGILWAERWYSNGKAPTSHPTTFASSSELSKYLFVKACFCCMYWMNIIYACLKTVSHSIAQESLSKVLTGSVCLYVWFNVCTVHLYKCIVMATLCLKSSISTQKRGGWDHEWLLQPVQSVAYFSNKTSSNRRYRDNRWINGWIFTSRWTQFVH